MRDFISHTTFSSVLPEQPRHSKLLSHVQVGVTVTGIDTTCKPDSDTEYGQYNLKVAGHGRWRIRQGTMACRAIKYKLEFDLVREVERAIQPGLGT